MHEHLRAMNMLYEGLKEKGALMLEECAEFRFPACASVGFSRFPRWISILFPDPPR